MRLPWREPAARPPRRSPRRPGGLTAPPPTTPPEAASGGRRRRLQPPAAAAAPRPSRSRLGPRLPSPPPLSSLPLPPPRPSTLLRRHSFAGRRAGSGPLLSGSGVPRAGSVVAPPSRPAGVLCLGGAVVRGHAAALPSPALAPVAPPSLAAMLRSLGRAVPSGGRGSPPPLLAPGGLPGVCAASGRELLLVGAGAGAPSCSVAASCPGARGCAAASAPSGGRGPVAAPPPPLRLVAALGWPWVRDGAARPGLPCPAGRPGCGAAWLP